MHDYWKKLICCVDCSKRLNKQVYYNTKKDRGSVYFICSRKKNYNDCSQPTLKESFLLDIIKNHLQMQNKDFDISYLKLFVLRIDVENGATIIRYRDGTISKISDSEIIF